MKDSGRVTIVAVLLLVVLRLAIGWQFLYEGLWKIDTLDSPQPWSSSGYLKNAQGPLRDHFRNLEGDPDELDWLDFDTVVTRWDTWHNTFANHYRLDEKQQSRLQAMINGSTGFVAALDHLPEGVDLATARVSTRVLRYDAQAKRLIVDGQQHLRIDERDKLLNLVKGRDEADAEAFRAAVKRVFDLSLRGLSYKEKLLAALKGDPDLAGNEEWQRLGELDQYKRLLSEYNADLKTADEPFEFDHLQYSWGKIQSRRAELTGPIKALEAEMKNDAGKMLTLDQLALGPEPQPWPPLRIADTLTIAGLTILGAMLIIGLGTRLAAVIGAFMLINFYLVMPPWPGVPDAPGPEHSFIVNKNLIEIFALLALAALPTGTWFGLDGVFGKWFGRRRLRPKSGSVGTPVASAAAKPGTESRKAARVPSRSGKT